jgi:hypothetical protein
MEVADLPLGPSSANHNAPSGPVVMPLATGKPPAAGGIVNSAITPAVVIRIKVQVDRSDGKSIWVFDRCSSNGCNPIQKFDATGKFVRGFGANMFVQPHGFYVDIEGNVWAADNGIRNGKGGVVVKFSPEGQVLMTLGHQGMPGNAEGFFNGASSVVVASNGDIFVGDGHGGNTNATSAAPVTWRSPKSFAPITSLMCRRRTRWRGSWRSPRARASMSYSTVPPAPGRC